MESTHEAEKGSSDSEEKIKWDRFYLSSSFGQRAINFNQLIGVHINER